MKYLKNNITTRHMPQQNWSHPHKKKFFCQLYFSLQKLWLWNSLCILHHTKNYVYTTVDGKCWCGKPLMRPTLCWSNFHATQHFATCCGMQKPCQSHISLTSTLSSIFVAWQSRILWHSATRHWVVTLKNL